MKFLGTREVAAILGVRPFVINTGVWQGRIPSPQKGPGGNYLWEERDIERAAWAIGKFSEFQSWRGEQDG